MDVNAVSRYRKKKKKIWFNIITLNILTLIIGGCAYYYYETSTLIKSLNTKIEQQNQTIDQQHHAQTALIDANHSLQQQLEEALQTKLTLEDENTSQEDQLVALTEQNEQLNQNISSLSSQLDELTKLNEQYIAERPLSVIDLETKYRKLLGEAQTKASELETAKNEVQKEHDKIQNYYNEINEHFYIKDDLKVKLVETRTENQHYWVTEVSSSDTTPLKGAMANDTYNGNRETISSMANRLNAVLAINASGFYAKTNKPMGTVVRNGELISLDSAYTEEILSLQSDGNLNFTTVNTEEEFNSGDIEQTFTFGPILIRDGQATQLSDKSRHPRTAIGQLNDNRYVIVVVEGRMEGADGMTLNELQQIFLNLGCKTAYNLDGGGSSTLIVRRQETFKPSQTFNDDKTGNWWVVNSPSDGAERSDANCLLLVAKVPELGFKTTKKTETTLSLTITNIEELGKYKDLYILKDDEMKQIENGTIEITNLNPSKIYSFPIYAKINEEYCYLFTKYTDKTALEMATIKNVNYSSVIKNEVISYQLSVSFNNNDCLKSVKFVIGDNEYIIKHSTITLNEDELNLLLTNYYKIVIVYDTENLTGEHTDELTSFEISVKSSIIVLDALVLKTNDLLNSIIK